MNKLWVWRVQCFQLNLIASFLCVLKILDSVPLTTTRVDSLTETVFGKTCVTCGDSISFEQRDLSLSGEARILMNKVRAFLSYKLPSNNLTILRVF